MFTKEDIFHQLEAMDAPRKGIVLVHTSLRAVGEVEGRGEGLLEVLIEYFTKKGGLLCIPTHTWANVGIEGKITLDMQEGKTCIGTLPDIAAKHPDAYRTPHATHSMAVFGKKQKLDKFVLNEGFRRTPTPPTGCYGKLYDEGHVLLIGVGHERNTYLHAVEEMLGVPNRLSKEPKEITILFKNGDFVRDYMHVHESEGFSHVSEHFKKFEPAFRYHGCIVDGKIGNAPAQLCNAKLMHAVMTMIRDRSERIELCADDTPLDEAWYK